MIVFHKYKLYNLYFNLEFLKVHKKFVYSENINFKKKKRNYF